MERDATIPAPAPGCLDVDLLVAMVSGALDAVQLDAVIAHVGGCAACAEIVGALARTSSPSNAPELARYEIRHVLGAGGMGIVYEAWDPQLRRRVALKVVRPERADAESHARMLREARSLARVNHPHVMTVYDVQDSGGQICVATELVDGETLATWQRGRSREEIVDAWLQAARGLAAAHAVDVIHRDIKPANVLVGRDGRVRVGDFGLARYGSDDPQPAAPSEQPSATDATVTAAGVVAGTPAYMAPEHAAGAPDARSDQFALCLSLAEALTGVRVEPDGTPAIDGPLRDVIARGLRADPDERFPTMAKLVAAIEAAIAPPPSPPRKRWPLVAAGGAAVLVLGAGGFVAVRASSDVREPPAIPGDIWSLERRASIVKVAGERVGESVDAWLATWSDASLDTVATEDDEVRARRTFCLREQLAAADRRLDRIHPGIKRKDAHIVVMDFPKPSWCSAAIVAHAVLPTLSQWLRSQPIRAQIFAQRGLTVDTLRAYLVEARAIGDPTLVEDVADELASREYKQYGSAAAVATLRDAASYVDGRDDLSWIMASTHLLLHTTNEAGADQLVEALRARIAKLGGDRVLEANVDLAYGFDRTDTAGRRALERARAGYRTVFGAGSFPEALVLELVANAYLRDEPERRDGIALWWQAYAIYKQLGLEDTAWPIEPTLDPQLRIARFAQLVEIASQQAPGSAELAQLDYALGTAYTFVPDWPHVHEHLERAIALFDRLAITSDDAAMAHALDTEALLRLHRTADVPPLARRAIAIAEPIHANPVIVIARQTLGHALIELKDYDGARAALEPLLPLHEQLRDSSASRGRTSFLLALATWTVDHKRAIGYAYAARRDYQSAIDAPFAPGVTPAVIASEMKLLDQIDAWIAKHPQ